MGMFRALSKKGTHIIHGNNSFDGSYREEGKSSGSDKHVSRRNRFKFRRSRESGSNDRSEFSRSPVSTTPIAQQAATGKDSLEKYVHATNPTSSSSVLENLQIISDYDDGCYKPYPLAHGVEVVTPDSKQQILEQRAAIRRILFEDNRESSACHDHVDSYRVLQEAEFEMQDDVSVSFETPPPPLSGTNDVPRSSCISVGTHVSQEVMYDGLVHNASLEELEFDIENGSNEQKYARNFKGFVTGKKDTFIKNPLSEGNDEFLNYKIPSGTRRSMPVSVDVSYTESELASLASEAMSFKSHMAARLNSEKSNPNPVLGSPEKSNNCTVSENYGGLAGLQVGTTEAVPGAVDDRVAQLYSKIISQVHDVDIVMVDTEMRSSDRPSAQQTLVYKASQTAAKAGVIESFNSLSRYNDGFSLYGNQPDDEKDFYEKQRENIPIPDDERLEFKDAVAGAIRLNSSSALDIVDLRHRPLAGSFSPTEYASPDVKSIEPSSIPKSKLLKASDTGSDDKSFSTDKNAVSVNLAESLNTVENGRVIEARKRDAASESGSFAPLISNESIQNVPVVEDTGEGYAGRDVNGQSLRYPEQERNNGDDRCRSPSLPKDRSNDCVRIEKKPSFFYTQDRLVDSRFMSRMVGNGFVLLYLQPPGCLGNPTEDWNGRTVTMMIQKGIQTPYASWKTDKDSGASAWSSVTFSTKDHYATGINSVTSIQSTKSAILQHPRLQWYQVAGGLATDVTIISVDLLKIQAVSTYNNEVDWVHNTTSGSVLSDEDENLCFFTVTTTEGVVHMFEAVSTNERNRIVKGLKALVARLSYHIISGNPTSSSELYHIQPEINDRQALDKGRYSNVDQKAKISRSLTIALNREASHPSVDPTVSGLSKNDEDASNDDELEGDLPLLSNPSDTMNRVAHVFLDL